MSPSAAATPLSNDAVLHNVSPVDLRPQPPVRVSTTADVQAAVAAARAAQKGWDAMGFEARAKAMKRAGRMLLQRRQELLALLHDEAGKPPGELLMGEALGGLQFVTDWIKVARPFLKEKKVPISVVAFPGKSAVVQSVPRGVVGVIAPWNFPIANFFKPVFAALLCGNAVVLKPSEFAPRTGAWFVKVLSDALPKDVLRCVQGDKAVGTALIRSGIDALTFTGSSASGRAVARLAGELLIPCSVELGGKDAAIVLADCDLDRTVAGVMHWSLTNAGQACGDIERVYVEEAIADRFVERLANAVSRLRVESGKPQTSDLGPLMTRAQLEIVEEHVGDAIARGGTVVCGGKRTGKGLYFQPTVIDHCADPEMLVLTEPTFGPVIPIVRVANADDAVKQSNACAYGLNASVWSKDLKRAEGIARRLEVGTAFVNNHAFTGAIPAAAWTGVKKTGSGVANSHFALHHYTRPRTVVIDRNKGADAWWFPMDGVMEELGNRLAEAQIGNVLAAVKVPLLLAQRQRTVMKFARAAAKVTELPRKEAEQPRRFGGLRVKLRSAVEGFAKAVVPGLTDKERTWGRTAMTATFAGVEDSPLPPLPRNEAEDAVDEVYEAFTFPANVGMRACLLAVGVSPVFVNKRWTTFEHLTQEEQIATLAGFYKSDSYLLRQVALIIKTTGALSHVSTTRFHAHVKS